MNGSTFHRGGLQIALANDVIKLFLTAAVSSSYLTPTTHLFVPCITRLVMYSGIISNEDRMVGAAIKRLVYCSMKMPGKMFCYMVKILAHRQSDR
jgi:hypothetical protein